MVVSFTFNLISHVVIIHIILIPQELAASQSIIHKRTGYLVCSCCLSPEHEFRFMLINQMQRDLISSNLLEACGALLAVTTLITADLVGTVSTQVMGLLEHTAETVRKKAIIALRRLNRLAPETATTSSRVEKVRRVLCDRDPGVMGSTLNAIETLARVNVQPLKDSPQLDFFPETNLQEEAAEHVRLPSHPGPVDADENC